MEQISVCQLSGTRLHQPDGRGVCVFCHETVQLVVAVLTLRAHLLDDLVDESELVCGRPVPFAAIVTQRATPPAALNVAMGTERDAERTDAFQSALPSGLRAVNVASSG